MTEYSNGQTRVHAKGVKAVEGVNRLMVEREKTRRLLIVSTVALTVIALLLVVFVPEERANVGYIVSGVLLILALGSIGVTVFGLKIPGAEINALPSNMSGDHAESRVNEEECA